MVQGENLPITTRIAYVIAEELGEDPGELSPPLDEVINVEALDELFAERENGTSRGQGLITFEYRDMYVNVDEHGYVTIEGNTRGLAESHNKAMEMLKSD